METNASLRVEEIVFLIDVEFLVIVSAAFLIELVVDAVNLVSHMAVLHVGEDIEHLVDAV